MEAELHRTARHVELRNLWVKELIVVSLGFKLLHSEIRRVGYAKKSVHFQTEEMLGHLWVAAQLGIEQRVGHQLEIASRISDDIVQCGDHLILEGLLQTVLNLLPEVLHEYLLELFGNFCLYISIDQDGCVLWWEIDRKIGNREGGHFSAITELLGFNFEGCIDINHGVGDQCSTFERYE